MESSTSSQPNQPYSPINHTNLDMNFEELIFSQDYNYSQDYSMGHGSGHGSMHGSALVHDDEDDSPVEEVSPVKPKKHSRRAARAKKDEPKEPPKDWTMARDRVVLSLKLVHQEVMTRSLANGKIGFALELVLFAPSSIMLKRIKKVVQFTSMKRMRLWMGRDLAKAKKKAPGSSRVGSSSLVDLVADKFFNIKQKKWGKKDEQQQSYIEFKNRELSIREAEAREIAQLKREKLEIQRRTLELAEREKRDRDILFYNSLIDPTLPLIQQQKLLEMKLKIKERYNLDY
ncbi:hypothetical protein Tco_0072057 [Tanacetum coccineum]